MEHGQPTAQMRIWLGICKKNMSKCTSIADCHGVVYLGGLVSVQYLRSHWTLKFHSLFAFSWAISCSCLFYTSLIFFCMTPPISNPSLLVHLCGSCFGCSKSWLTSSNAKTAEAENRRSTATSLNVKTAKPEDCRSIANKKSSILNTFKLTFQMQKMAFITPKGALITATVGV